MANTRVKSDPQPESNPSSNQGFVGFVEYLRNYVAAWPILLACLIGPITKYLHLLPVYKDHENLLAAITSLYGVLLVSALFFYRGVANRKLVKGSGFVLAVPALLILTSVGFCLTYIVLVQSSIRAKRTQIQSLVESSQLASSEILSRTDLTNIPDGVSLVLCYLGMFFAAETALVWMALRDFTGSKQEAHRRSAAKQ